MMNSQTKTFLFMGFIVGGFATYAFYHKTLALSSNLRGSRHPINQPSRLSLPLTSKNGLVKNVSGSQPVPAKGGIAR